MKRRLMPICCFCLCLFFAMSVLGQDLTEPAIDDLTPRKKNRNTGIISPLALISPFPVTATTCRPS